MKNLTTLLKIYELSSDVQYFEMILLSILNGQRNASKNLFLELRNKDRKSFVKYITTVITDEQKNILSQSEIHWFIDNI